MQTVILGNTHALHKMLTGAVMITKLRYPHSDNFNESLCTYFYSHIVELVIFMMDVTILDPTVMDFVIHL